MFHVLKSPINEHFHQSPHRPVIHYVAKTLQCSSSELVVMAYFEAEKIDHVVTKPMPEKPPNSWKADNKFVCAVITQTVDSSNLHHVQEHRCDTFNMWKALSRANQDSSTGGVELL
ncbi:hypothetical protein VP01_9704g1 [Puccinia sorghi]|uniref:Uncharacterized protein n=1 Tax=Puccinia sorghi TaxID=27349 RepID=A0A0L6U5Y5_9BASI|nr:hypothetical protein VP01_9704g1 [Puccinia sorghi]